MPSGDRVEAPTPAEVEDAAGLFTVPPHDFVAARDALARRLRSEGDKEEARRVAKLRRPTPVAWALNRVARAQPGLIHDLFLAGGELRAATEQAVGGDASALRGARAAERVSVEVVIRAASGFLSEVGTSANETTRQRLAATLRAAVVEESVAGLLRQGTLTQDHEAPGFGMEALAPALAASGRLDASTAPDDVGPGRDRRSTTESDHLAVDADRGAVESHPDAEADHLAAERGRSVTDAEGGAVETDRPDAPARGAVEADRLAMVAERLATEADQVALEAGRSAAESARLMGEARRLRSEAQRLAAEAAAAARAAVDTEAAYAEAEARAAEAARLSVHARNQAAAPRQAADDARSGIGSDASGGATCRPGPP